MGYGPLKLACRLSKQYQRFIIQCATKSLMQRGHLWSFWSIHTTSGYLCVLVNLCALSSEKFIVIGLFPEPLKMPILLTYNFEKCSFVL